MSDKFIVGTSVVMFRLRAERLFHVWSHLWLTLLPGRKVSRHDVELQSERIRMAFRDVLRRNPSIREWVQYTLYFDTDTRQYLMSDHLRSLNLPVEDGAFNPSKPWWVWLQIAGRDEQVALQTFSYQVARCFLHASGRDASLASEDIDWTDTQNIEEFIRNLAKPLKTKHFWQFWK